MNGLMMFNPREDYGNIGLSIQASAYHYCSQRVDGLPLQEYRLVEVAIIQDGARGSTV